MTQWRLDVLYTSLFKCHIYTNLIRRVLFFFCLILNRFWEFCFVFLQLILRCWLVYSAESVKLTPVEVLSKVSTTKNNLAEFLDWRLNCSVLQVGYIIYFSVKNYEEYILLIQDFHFHKLSTEYSFSSRYIIKAPCFTKRKW